MLVTSLITSNVQNDGFIAKVLAVAKNPTTQTLAHEIFAETVPSALLFSAAISSVVNYYAEPSRKDKLQDLIHLSTAATGDDDTDRALMRFIVEALSMSSATFHLTLESHQKAVRRQDVSPINQQKRSFLSLPVSQVQNGVRFPPHLHCPIFIIHVVIAARSDCWRSQGRHS